MDAVHPAHNSMPAHGWMRKGKKTDLKSNSGRQRLNIHGAMNAETYEVVPLISESSVNSDSTISLLKYLEILYPLATTFMCFWITQDTTTLKKSKSGRKHPESSWYFCHLTLRNWTWLNVYGEYSRRMSCITNITKRLMSLNQRATVSSRTKTTTMMRFARSWGAGLKV